MPEGVAPDRAAFALPCRLAAIFEVQDFAFRGETREERHMMRNARLTRLTILALSLVAGPQAVVSTAAAEQSTTGGPAALALAAVVARQSPLVSAGDKSVVASLFDGKSASYPAGKKISVTADSVICRVSNAEITARSCELAFAGKKLTVTGDKANSIYATIAVAGVAPDGAAGTIYEGLTKLACTIDPNAIKQNDGEGADCAFEAGP
jgi:hypothetical protein